MSDSEPNRSASTLPTDLAGTPASAPAGSVAVPAAIPAASATPSAPLAPAQAAARSDQPVLLGASDIPAFCPNPAMPLWSAHPRVFLDVTRTGSASCPYCGTRYQLKPGTVLASH